MNKQNQYEGVVYTIKRTYKGTYSVNELISSIIKTHYYEEVDKKPQKSEEDKKFA